LSHAGEQPASGTAIQHAVIETERHVGFHDGHKKVSNRRLEFQLCAGFVGPRGFVLVLSTARAMEHGLSPFGRANLNPRRNPLDQ